MQPSYGKLVLVEQEGPGREFGLSKASITLGRALSNDLVLGDARASREHARLECGAGGCEIVDLGSANGTRLNGKPVQRAALKPGDVVGVGSSQLRFEAETAFADDLELTRLDSESDLARTMEREILPMAINETNLPRLVVFDREQATEVPLQGVERVTIGRTEGNDVAIDQGNVSRQHAEVVRRGGAWLLRDLGSTNGTWLRGEAVDERLLQDGDAFRIGRAQIVFKGGHAAEALTMAEATFARTSTRRPVVFVPGLMGSDLWAGNERVWPSVKSFLTNPDQFRYPGGAFESRAIVDELVIVPNLIKQDQYNRLGDYLVEELGYRRGVDYFEFPYDWRQDVRQSARELAQTIDGLPTSRPVTIMSHSLGTLVTRYYVERLGGRSRVDRAILMGGPHLGTVKGLVSLLVSPSVLPFGLLGERLRRVLMTFPSCYQIVPTYACGVDQNGKAINFLEDEGWVAEEHLPLLRAAREFRRELGTTSSVPTLSIFGYGIKTLSGITVRRTNGTFSDVVYKSEPNGDSGILVTSAVLPGSDIHPVQQYHGALFTDNDVKMRLKLELARGT